MPLTTQDKFEILEQIHAHQRAIDNPAGSKWAQKYADLYWPDARFHTLYTTPVAVYEGPQQVKQLYDFAHTVFPIDQHKHLATTFVIDGDGDEATAEWYWIVIWRKGVTGIVSSGTYFDRFQKRNGQWKCLERRHAVDDNWPRKYFEDYMAAAASAAASTSA